MKTQVTYSLRMLGAAGALLAAGALIGGNALAADAPLKIGVITFLSGPAAPTFGVPAKNAAEMLAKELNAGKAPAPYAAKGFGGRALELIFVDENGGTTKQVTEYRNLIQQQNADMVVAYDGSGDCLAVAPVAEELKKLTVFFDCGTPRIFEDGSYKYVFRTGAVGTMDDVGAAMYLKRRNIKVNTYSGINQNYAWGQDAWNNFVAAMKQVYPQATIASTQFPKFMAGQFGAEISALMSKPADIIHSSFWGGDADAFVLQAAPRGFFKKTRFLLTPGESAIQTLGTKLPEGTIIGARGPFSVFAPNTPLNTWFHDTYLKSYKVLPNYNSYKMATALLGLKSAYEKAQSANKGATPNQDQVIAAFEHLSYEGPGGRVEMALGKGHQAVYDIAYGTVKHVNGKVSVDNIIRIPWQEVTPPEGMKSEDWINSGFKK